ncbi:hypothetical protein E4K66_25465 [Bradyrhizobium frederickii]|uniref:Uncharacterized protein n=1 Tax=Bradyrhizobium frederickii TaxID=2560054 RepID=A0A4Y9KWG1_9BRAD|nr:hypothetical protein [Bradyrhizobium frederickii]TFV35670.1 hypothetical protein E4K66_25465 [Bradyrhizobium frederickii]
MRVTERDKRRLDAITTAIKPRTSLAARIESLTETQRAAYEHWRQRQSEFLRQHPGDGEAYAWHLNGRAPRLSERIKSILFGAVVHIPSEATEQDAATTWTEAKEK